MGMDKHEKAQIVKAITLLNAGECRRNEALEILYGLAGLVYPGPRPQNLHHEDRHGSPGEEADRLVDRRKWEEVLNV